MGPVGRLLLCTLLGLLGHLQNSRASTPVIQLSDTTQQISFEEGLYVLNDPLNQLSVQDLVRESRSYQFEAVNTPISLVNHQTIWLRFTAENVESGSLPMLLEIDYPYLETVSAYVISQRGPELVVPELGWRIPAIKRPYVHRNFVLPISFPGRQSVEVYVRIRREAGMLVIPVRLWQPEAFRLHDLNETMIWGLIVGWLLFAVGFSLFVFAVHRQNIYLFYSFYILVQSGALLSTAGLLENLYFNADWGIGGNHTRQILMLLSAGSNFLFVRSFVTIKKSETGWYSRWSRFTLLAWGGLAGVVGVFGLFTGTIDTTAEQTAFEILVGLIRLVYALILFLTLSTVIKGLRLQESVSVAQLYLLAFTPLLLISLEQFLGWLMPNENYTHIRINDYIFAVVFETVVLLFGLIYRFKTYRDERENALRQQNQLALQAQQTERARLARELHDGVGPELAVLKMQLEIESDQNGAVPRPQLKRFIEDVDRISRDIRDVSHALMPADLRAQGLVLSLEQLVAQLTAVQSGAEINFTHGDIGQMTAVVEQTVYQMTKELLNNMFKHAHASLIDIELYRQNGNLLLTIADNGVGYDPAIVERVEGIGLRNIQTSAEALQGEFEIRRKPTGGMLHRITLPV
ncbi:hypothetical protein HNV11_03095 [Spirosoma taeanense]|uniref:histidine kinase n=1 Tax=Spirosoma taeanense TaxID=2735870 RepID=A0A6M5Y0Y9_9BACT|nr:7TM-DISM domain-containing protein [Spirosoma taeanense]QJW88428.1 hypothetical protein HNV11_03095 [Spirosoma taeanense]